MWFGVDVTNGEALPEREEHLAHSESMNIRLPDGLEDFHKIAIAGTSAHIGAFHKKDAEEYYDAGQVEAYFIDEFEELTARESRFPGNHQDLYERYSALCMRQDAERFKPSEPHLGRSAPFRRPSPCGIAPSCHGGEGYSARPMLARMKAYSSATSWRRSYLPERPPWPAPMLVFSKSRLSSVFSDRSFATNLAASQ